MSLSADPPLNIYLPLRNYFYNRVAVVVRTDAPEQIAGSLRTVVHDLDPELPVPALEMMEDRVSASVAARRFQMTLVLVLAAAAILLASIGIYGVVSQVVSQRTSEFGIRMALGAGPARVQRLVMAQSLVPVAAGLGIGLAVTVQLGGLLRSLLFGVTPHDPAALGGAVAALLGVALAATYLPTRRATRVEPIQALRCE